MTQAREELDQLLRQVENFRQRNGLGSVTISVVGGGTGQAYGFRGADRLDATIGRWKNDSPGEATPRESR